MICFRNVIQVREAVFLLNSNTNSFISFLVLMSWGKYTYWAVLMLTSIPTCANHAISTPIEKVVVQLHMEGIKCYTSYHYIWLSIWVKIQSLQFCFLVPFVSTFVTNDPVLTKQYKQALTMILIMIWAFTIYCMQVKLAVILHRSHVLLATMIWSLL